METLINNTECAVPMETDPYENATGKVELAIMFTDIRGFTAFSESHAEDEVLQLLNDMMSVQACAIREEGGRVDKFIGDGMLAIFAGDDREFRAIDAALKIRAQIETLGALPVGIGIHSGEAFRGPIGCAVHTDFTIIGRNVNLSARLCGLAGRQQVGGEQIVISEVVASRVSRAYVLSALGKARLKGFPNSECIFAVTAGTTSRGPVQVLSQCKT